MTLRSDIYLSQRMLAQSLPMLSTSLSAIAAASHPLLSSQQQQQQQQRRAALRSDDGSDSNNSSSTACVFNAASSATATATAAASPPPSSSPPAIDATSSFDWYSSPFYYDTIFAEDTPVETRMLLSLFSLYGSVSPPSPRSRFEVLEPACGSARLMLSLLEQRVDVAAAKRMREEATRGSGAHAVAEEGERKDDAAATSFPPTSSSPRTLPFRVTGFDVASGAVAYAKKAYAQWRLQRDRREQLMLRRMQQKENEKAQTQIQAPSTPTTDRQTSVDSPISPTAPVPSAAAATPCSSSSSPRLAVVDTEQDKEEEFTVFEADMCDFSRTLQRVRPGVRYDFAHCLVSTIKHLQRNEQVLQHFQQMHRVLREGGLYVVALHIHTLDGKSHFDRTVTYAPADAAVDDNDTQQEQLQQPPQRQAQQLRSQSPSLSPSNGTGNASFTHNSSRDSNANGNNSNDSCSDTDNDDVDDRFRRTYARRAPVSLVADEDTATLAATADTFTTPSKSRRTNASSTTSSTAPASSLTASSTMPSSSTSATAETNVRFTAELLTYSPNPLTMLEKMVARIELEPTTAKSKNRKSTTATTSAPTAATNGAPPLQLQQEKIVESVMTLRVYTLSSLHTMLCAISPLFRLVACYDYALIYDPVWRADDAEWQLPWPWPRPTCEHIRPKTEEERRNQQLQNAYFQQQCDAGTSSSTYTQPPLYWPKQQRNWNNVFPTSPHVREQWDGVEAVVLVLKRVQPNAEDAN